MSKYRFAESSIYLSGTDLPRNRLGVTDAETLHSLETELLSSAFELFVQDLDDSVVFDEAYFKALHRQTFESLYEWAGLYRTVDMRKDGSLFCRAQFLEQESKRIFDELSKENYLKQTGSGNLETFAKRLAYFQCELIALHPFYELNGRITRLFFDLIAVYNGYNPIDYSSALSLAGKANIYIEASIACVQQADCGPLEKIILSGLKQKS